MTAGPWTNHDLAPPVMTGGEGETVFIRRDRAGTAAMARRYAAWYERVNVDGWDVDEVEMLPVPEHFLEVDADWWVVKPGTPDAVAYWRFRA